MRLDLDKVKQVVGTVAPSLAHALGGPLAGTAAAAIAEKLGFEGHEAALAQALEAPSPDQLVALKELEVQFAVDMERAGIELAKIDVEDRVSARDRQVRMKDWTPTILGVCIIGGFFATIVLIFRFGLPENGRDVLIALVGVMGGMTTQVGNFFFGSSMGSKNKDAIIENLRGALD
ncbi:MAG: hypothetical protein ACU0CO_10255 [Shimia sp.]